MSRLRRRAVRRLLRLSRGLLCTPAARWPYEWLTATIPAPAGVRFERVSANGVPATWCVPENAPPDRVLLYLHGGGYVFGSGRGYRCFAGELARLAGCRALAIDYRLAPEHPFPAAYDDALTAYRWLLDRGATETAVSGDSAGGGLSLALLAAVRDAGLTLPRAAYVISPWTDLAGTGESVVSKASVDPTLSPKMITRLAEQYLHGQSATDPRVSPLYGNLSGLPPIYVQVGEDEILHDDSTRYAEKARAAGSPVEIEVLPKLYHAFHVFLRFLPEAREALDRGGRFLREHWATDTRETFRR
ncbi:MAG TPA: alpha/beta hydrolase [Pirellulales bacterium]